MSKRGADYLKALPDTAFAYVASDGSRHLPFRNAEGRVDLPFVRDSLASLGQLEMSADEKAIIKEKLQGSLKASDADDDVMSFTTALKAADGDNGLPQRMMLLRAGNFNTQKYGEVPIKKEDLVEMAENFKAGIGMAGDGSTGIPVDYSHESHKNAAAWIKDMTVENESELWATSIEWSGSGRKAVQDKEYKCLSSDFYPAAFGEWVDAESGARAKNVIVGAALTNRPMFTGNQPLTASETTDKDGNRQITKFVIANEKESSMDINAIRVKAAEDVTVQEQRFLQANAKELSAEELKKFEVVAPVKADEKPEPKKVQASSVKGDEGVVAIEASELKGMADKIAGLEASEQTRVKASMGAEVDKAIERGAIKADRKDSYVNRLVSASEDDRKELLADLEAMSDNPVLAKEQGKGDADENSSQGAREKIMAMATEVVRKSQGKTNITAALEAVKTENPELAESAAAERKQQINASDDQYAAAGVNRG